MAPLRARTRDSRTSVWVAGRELLRSGPRRMRAIWFARSAQGAPQVCLCSG